ncbi:metal-dependent transcriptional regulator [Ornithinimicrobium avium]|uniref:Manganese transport regulator n=1 Tax=Ornithinimicrobium avium TaxID=2283195 RepID=A0A345NLN5_9MICO|nr:metal-dependent transcriptional regulator [Ornithinimicrobium avium]AXH95943.1 metal-dependent transcriptional regulator [Ornithinimicrobium avium]
MELSEITPVAQDYLKVIWSATEWAGAAITTTGLARRMGTTAPNVTDTLRRLASQGLVEYTPYRPVALTTLGERYAVAMVRRHRLLETFLVTSLGYRWEEVHDEAERLEHAVSDTMIERISALLGHPEADPHGDPIPSATGKVHRPPGAAPLADVSQGEYVVVRVSDSDPGVLVRLSRRGVAPGAHLRAAAGGVVRPGRGGGHPTGLTAEEVGAIWVVPAGPTT